MSKNLFIVESPAKAKTIEKFLGKDFTVKSSVGHIRDLSEKGLGIDIEDDFKPIYEVPEDKKSIVTELKKNAKAAEAVWLATDEDREGEAISWHLAQVLGLDIKKAKRVVYHEITKKAIEDAIKNPRSIDLNLVNAQQARRVLDRLVGYELSPVLWKKIKPSLSAGRVQSVAVRLIVEREREIQEFNSVSSYKISAVFALNGKNFKAELSKRFPKREEALSFLNKCVSAEFSVLNLEVKPAKKSPAAPFTTSTLQQEASRKLGFSVSRTMMVAQKLYEAGKITYMRTDSVNLSQTALDAATTEIGSLYGDQYIEVRKYANKSKGAQEAHEAIRPTYLDKQSVDGDAAEKKLYDLIWKRTIASQMSDAQIERTIVHIVISTTDEQLVAKGEVLKFDGFLKVYLEDTDEESEEEENSSILPPLKVGDKPLLNEMKALERFSQHPPRYTEASLVKKLEELGIGRPSTYAPTISTVQKRGYVEKEERAGKERKYHELILKTGKISEEVKTEITGQEKNKLFPTDIGMVVNDFLVLHFKNILDYNFTASIEKEFDEIADGQIEWTKMIKQFYNPFHVGVEKTLEKSERPKGERLLGKDPKTGKPVIVRMGRFGPMAQIGETNTEEGAEKPKFAGLRKDQRLETITLEEALALFAWPRIVGTYEEGEMAVNIGRFGPYIKLNDKFYSIPKEHDPMDIDEELAIQIINAKRKAESEKVIKTFDGNADVKVLNGRWGPYIAAGKKNVKIPKAKDPKSLTLDECLQLAAEAPEKKKGGWGRKKK
jgi:DNA topoisomerase-1